MHKVMQNYHNKTETGLCTVSVAFPDNIHLILHLAFIDIHLLSCTYSSSKTEELVPSYVHVCLLWSMCVIYVLCLCLDPHLN